jgi:hypothetical protein
LRLNLVNFSSSKGRRGGKEGGEKRGEGAEGKKGREGRRERGKERGEGKGYVDLRLSIGRQWFYYQNDTLLRVQYSHVNTQKLLSRASCGYRCLKTGN